jgi:uncharacterized protein (TIGR04255 family)
MTIIPGAMPQVKLRPRWAFLSSERGTAVVLSESTLALHTATYTSLEPFLEQLRAVAGVVNDEAPIDLVSRIGMRYIDRIADRDELPIREAVVPGLLGFPLRALGEDLIGAAALRTEIAGVTRSGMLVVRSFLLPPGQIVPPDLEQGQVVYPEPQDLERSAISMDFDHFTEFSQTPFPFDPDAIVGHAEVLHGTLRRAFDHAATVAAFEAWGPWEDE